MNTVFVKPGDGRRVRIPGGRLLDAKDAPKQAVEVKRTIFVERRLACGDLVEVKTKAQPADAATQPAGKPAPDVKAS
jgi:hypothetical protein